MSGNELIPRRYGDKEVGKLLRRATEIQRAEPTAENPEGLTIAELEDVAKEAGIDPRYLRRAAAELEVGGASEIWTKLAGAPTGFVLERVVPGEVPESMFEELVPIMQTATIGQGTASAVGKTLTWTSRSDSNSSSQQILIAYRDGETTIRIEERMTGFAGGLFGGLLGGVGAGVGIGAGGAVAGVLGSVALAFVIPALAFGSAYAAARTIWKAEVKKRRRRMQDLLDNLADRIESEVIQRQLPGSPGDAPGPRGIELPGGPES